MTSKEKIIEILNWVQGSYMDWNCMRGLKQELDELVVIAQTEGVKEAKDALNEVWNNT